MFSRRDASPTTNDRPSTERPPQGDLHPPTPAPVAPQPVAQQAAPRPAPAPAAPATAHNADESLVAREDTFEGQLNTTRGVRILGTVRGTIESAQYVHIEEHAQVESDITAAEVVIAGTYTGTLIGRQRVEIRSTGHVSGKIETEKLQLHEGGFFDGQLHMQKPTGTPTSPAMSSGPAASAAPAMGDAKDSGLTRRTRHVDLPSDTPLARDTDSPKS